MYQGPPCLGIKPGDSNQTIKEAAFDFAHGIGYMSVATVAIDGRTPTNRGLEVHYLDSEKNLYVGASRGKHFYDEMEKQPYISALAIDVVAVRINAWLEKDDRESVRERYWELNQGTKKMYHKDLSNFQVYRLVRGEGEIFHVYEHDAIARARFSFGGEKPRPWSYEINERCIGCGICVEKCMMDTIHMVGNVAKINHYGCNECGICFSSCPHNSIDKLEFVKEL
ncbi:MAG TPA: 4Fe-4S dicluster domain-containing protein [Clostridia bacterium]|nr:4Fe-4S dicluster domain-containing protein [Clostridia bacterium]